MSDKFYLIRNGNKQYRVLPGQQLMIDYCNPQGETILLDCICNENGISNSQVKATVLKPLVKGEKILIWKKKRRKGYEKKIGFRHSHTLVKVL